MNKAIIDSIEWHKDQLFKLLGDDDLVKIEGSVQSVKSDLNEIIEKAKSKKRVWVKATATKKGYYREMEVGRVEGDKSESAKIGKLGTGNLLNLSGLYGRVEEINHNNRYFTLRDSKGNEHKITFDDYNKSGGPMKSQEKRDFEHLENKRD